MAMAMASSSLQPSWLSPLNSLSSTKPTLYPSKPFKLYSSLNPPNAEEPSPETTSSEVDPVKLAMENAKAYKKKNTNLKTENKPSSSGSGGSGSGSGPEANKEFPAAVKLAMEKAKEYKQKKKQVVGSAPQSKNSSGYEGNESKDRVEKKGKLSVSSMDFVGLGFADKKEGRALPAGLVPVVDDFPQGKLPEVEIIVGDSSNFGKGTRKPEQSQGSGDPDLYKPKVSSWGVFPRPNDISKTFGGGRTIRPGEVLETEEERAAKEARTRQLVAAYKSKMGLNIAPKLRLECEKTINDGDSLMNAGRLKEALPYYEKVMAKLPFKSELHGLAALQWSICQDSLTRSNEARNMYERLQSHPTAKVSKKARQFLFSFQAMEMMKISRCKPWRNTGYQNFFEAFIANKSNYVPEDGEVEVDSLSATLPYILLLVSPIFLVLLIAIQKRL